jgi:DMSO/TMAO reductase YedYZ heme-binding membrane subunit
MFQKLLLFCAPNRSKIIHGFQFLYLIWILFVLFAAWQIFSEGEYLSLIMQASILAGQSALVLLIIVTTPGILGRFGLKHPLITIGIMFRRHLGISTFLLAMLHALTVHFLPRLAYNSSIFSFTRFGLFGLAALTCLTLLASTSNDWSVKVLGKNWKRLHRLVYVIFWLMFLHVALQRSTNYMILIGGAGVLEIVSLLYDFVKKKLQPPTPTPPVVG